MPAIMRILDDFGPVQGPVGNKGFTDDKTPAISGYAEPDSIVRLYSNGVLVGSAGGENGQWTITPALSDGEQRLSVTATDKFGQVSVDSPVYTLFVNTPRIDKPQLLEVFDNEGVNTGVIKPAAQATIAAAPERQRAAGCRKRHHLRQRGTRRRGTGD